MIRTKTRAFALAAAAAFMLGGAGLLYAQTQEMGMDRMGLMMSMMGNCPMMAGMSEGPAAILRHKDELGLSAEQVARFESMGARNAQAHEDIVVRMRDMHQQIRATADGERFDEEAVRAAFRRMGEVHADMAVTLLRTRRDARAVLSAEQRAKLAQLTDDGHAGDAGMMHGMKEMHGMGGMHGKMEMMKNCPMLQDSMKQREDR